jgi:hypothetical protein
MQAAKLAIVGGAPHLHGPFALWLWLSDAVRRMNLANDSMKNTRFDSERDANRSPADGNARTAGLIHLKPGRISSDKSFKEGSSHASIDKGDDRRRNGRNGLAIVDGGGQRPDYLYLVPIQSAEL